MRNSRNYSVGDLINDDGFVRWIRFPDPQSDAFWADLIAENPDILPVIEEAARFIKMFGDQHPGVSAGRLQTLHQQINDRIDTPVSASTVHQIVLKRSRRNRQFLLAAIVTIALLAFSAWWIVKLDAGVVEPIQTVTIQETSRVQHMREHVVPKGRRSRVILDDGTQIWINAGSKLQYDPDFLSGATRDVYLQGEAFFDVVSDEAHPFVVHVQGVEVKALGTSFNVKGYNEDLKIETTLVHGKIAIVGDSVYDDVMLAANQRAVFVKQKKDMVVENNVETETYTAWRQGVLVFEDQPLYEIIPVLERTFNVTMHTEDAHALDCRFTAKINNKSLHEVLELFRTSDTIGYDIVADNVYIRGSFCND